MEKSNRDPPSQQIGQQNIYLPTEDELQKQINLQSNKNTYSKLQAQKFRSILPFAIIVVGKFCVVLCIVVFKIMNQLDKNFSFVELLFIRGLFQTIIQSIQFRIIEPSINHTKEEWRFIFLRSILSLLSMLTYWQSAQYLQAYVISSIQFSTPIVLALSAYIILGEEIK